MIKTFWQKVITLISSIISKPIPVTTEMCALGLFPVSLSLPGYHTKMIDICLVIARCLIAFYWKNIGPSIDHWLKDLAHYIVLERIIYSIKGKLKDYHKIWDLFIQFLENIQISAQATNTSHSTD